MAIFRTIDRLKLTRMNRGHLDLSVPDSLYKKMMVIVKLWELLSHH